ncbi:major facilitator superfamily domain-containing protein [Talaromyces proteolyticus]|uniref:Major facilitator superfamily domain-containing protein n=1 Tax=Talaromyces proteolyticus TaxID=1131652 RepID=A0AAD4KLY0_9EURO|nr:major facilitator superfamily domain-containing protein [Talaromyces proteolyticus]KAH8692211.1 major facilitator superfamily domain-containing protein [Talaromyces proteolyticus]
MAAKEISQSEHVDDIQQKVPDLPLSEADLAGERKLVRKLDMTLMPIIWVMYLFNYLDRNNIAQAKLDSFEADLGLRGDNFNTAVSILNVGYMLMQLPSNMLITRVRPSLYIPFWICLWSCISAATAGVHNYTGLILVRLFLGVAEAPFFPGAFYLLSCWYTKKELAFRTAILYSGLVLATAFSGLLAAGIFSGLDGTRGIKGWRWLFIIEGAGSFLAGLCGFFLLPDLPGAETGSTSWLFTAEERRIAKDRMIRDQVSNQVPENSVWYGLRTAVSDFRVWIFAIILCSNHTAYGFNNFYPTIVKGLGLGNTTITLVCTAPPYLLSTIIALISAYSSDHLGDRGYHIGGLMALAAAGFIISIASPPTNHAVLYFASFLYITGTFSANSMVYTWAAASVSQTPEKRACATAIVNLMGQLGNIWSPYFFRPQDSPRYVLAMVLMIAFSGLSIVGCAVMKMVLRRDNKKLVERFAGTAITPNLHVL